MSPRTKWFREARSLRSGDDYVAGDVESQPLLGNAQVASYCASVRADGKAHGKPTGVLAIYFDREPQARAIVQGVRVGAADKARVLLVDSNFRVIAASDGQGLLTDGSRFRWRDGAAASITTAPAHWSRSMPRLATRPTRASAGSASSSAARRNRIAFSGKACPMT